MIYVDSSALIAIYSERRPYADLIAYFIDRPSEELATSSIGIVETIRSLDRMGTYPDVQRRMRSHVIEIKLDGAVRDAAGTLPGRLRTLDAIHVASAQSIDSSLDVVISYDRRMLDVARQVGLPTASPGLS